MCCAYCKKKLSYYYELAVQQRKKIDETAATLFAISTQSKNAQQIIVNVTCVAEVSSVHIIGHNKWLH